MLLFNAQMRENSFRFIQYERKIVLLTYLLIVESSVRLARDYTLGHTGHTVPRETILFQCNYPAIQCSVC